MIIMLKRIITGIMIFIVSLVTAIFSSTPVLPIVVSALAVCGVYEMAKCTAFIKNLVLFVPAVICAGAMPLCTRFFSNHHTCLLTYLAVFYVLLVFFLTCALFSHRKISIEMAAVAFSTTLYIVFGFTSIVLLRDIKFGGYICLLAVGLPWVCDVFAYFIGRFFGKHKLIPDVSPKKTVEGAIGGMIFCTLVCVGYCYAIFRIMKNVNDINFIAVFIAGIVIAVVSQIGDLIASLIKRKYNVKDYSNLLPGHGGILDRFDSILTTAPFTLLLFLLPWGLELFN